MTTQKKTRRPYGSGSITVNKKINRYTVTWTDENGKKHSKNTFPLNEKGQKEAKQFLSKINSLKNQGIATSKQNTLAKWLIKTLIIKKNTVRPNTLRRYKDIAKMVPEYLLKKPINEITHTDIQKLYETLLEKYKPGTIHFLHSLLLSTFKNAYTERIITYNVVNETKKPRKNKSKIVIYTPREIATILRYMRKNESEKANEYILLIRILHGTGMRIGEALALKWTNIDIANREIYIENTLTGTEEGETKTEAGNRIVPILSNKTLKILEERKKEGKTYVFETENGTPIPYYHILYIWKKMNRKTKIHKKLHCWRHTWATNMLKLEFPITEVSRILGHSSPTVTMDIYAHFTPNYNKIMIKRYNERNQKY